MAIATFLNLWLDLSIDRFNFTFIVNLTFLVQLTVSPCPLSGQSYNIRILVSHYFNSIQFNPVQFNSTHSVNHVILFDAILHYTRIHYFRVGATECFISINMEHKLRMAGIQRKRNSRYRPRRRRRCPFRFFLHETTHLHLIHRYVLYLS
jgi:hypothetical protein